MTHTRIPLPRQAVDITGQKFGMLTAIMPVDKYRGSTMMWLCDCDCGQQAVVLIGNLRKGNSKSCGCDRMRGCTTHGFAHLPEYKPWTAMKYRCDNPNNSVYYKYGGRGIKVCNRWYDFALFMDDMGDRPDGTSIDRIDNDGDYTTENCRWATSHEQSRNKRSNRIIRFAGKEKCAADWEDEIGISAINILNRIDACGWSIERALTEPVKIRGKYKHHV